MSAHPIGFLWSTASPLRRKRYGNLSLRQYRRRRPPTITPSGDDAHEALVQFALIVEDRLADLIDRPHPLRVIGVIDEPTRENLIAVSRRIEEVDGLTSRDTVPGRADVEWNVVAGDDVGSLADLVPGIQRKRDVVKLGRLGPPNEGNVVRLV